MPTTRRLFICSLAGVAATALPSPEAQACSCLEVGSPEEHLARADVVFRGEVLCTEPVPPDPATEDGLSSLLVATRFEVLDVYKADADLGRQIEVQHFPNICCICGVDFRVGMTPLLLAERHDGVLRTNSCMLPRFRESAYRAALQRIQP